MWRSSPRSRLLKPKCFKCEKPILSAVRSESAEDFWDCPQGVVLSGGGNFGSRLYDGWMDGIYIEIVICDDCLKANKKLIREVHRPEATFGAINKRKKVKNGD